MAKETPGEEEVKIPDGWYDQRLNPLERDMVKLYLKEEDWKHELDVRDEESLPIICNRVCNMLAQRY